MNEALRIGTPVVTALGKGVVREVRNGGRLLVDVGGRSVVFEATAVTAVSVSPARRRKPRLDVVSEDSGLRASHSMHAAAMEIDLHGFTVEEALPRIVDAVNAALLADRAVLRFIHGRSGGRLRGALHRQLRGIPSVRGFRLDPRNPGVTVVDL